MNNQDLFETGMKCTTFEGDETTDPDEISPGWYYNRDFDDSNWNLPS